MTTLEAKAGQDARTCAGPDCDVPLKGQQARYCGERCRKAAYRDRVRATRPAPAHTARTKRRPPERQEAALDAFRRALEAEAERSLRSDPDRWRHAQAADPDHHRSKPRRSDHDAGRQP